MLYATIFFDFRPGFGELALGERLRDHLTKKVQGQEVFLRLLAKDTLTTPSPLTMFRNFVTGEKGRAQEQDRLSRPRAWCPSWTSPGCCRSSMASRRPTPWSACSLLGEGGHISSELTTEAVQAYEFQMQLRLVHQQRMDEQGLEPDNYLDPNDLSDLERHTLKDAFAVTNDIKSASRISFRLDQG